MKLIKTKYSFTERNRFVKLDLGQGLIIMLYVFRKRVNLVIYYLMDLCVENYIYCLSVLVTLIYRTQKYFKGT